LLGINGSPYCVVCNNAFILNVTPCLFPLCSDPGSRRSGFHRRLAHGH
jgi:hypothetical protein